VVVGLETAVIDPVQRHAIGIPGRGAAPGPGRSRGRGRHVYEPVYRSGGGIEAATLIERAGVGPETDLVDHHARHGDGVAARPGPLRVGSADRQVEVLLVGALAVRPLECAAELCDRGEGFVQERGGFGPGTDGRGERRVEQFGSDA
jgi:hypothetical protein